MSARIISSPVEVEVPNIPIHKLIIDKVRRFGDKTFLIEYETGNEYTYVKLLNDSLRVASALKKSQLNPGDIFMVYGFNCYECIVALLSGLFVGGIALPVRGADTTSEFYKELDSKDVRLLFIDSKLLNTAVSVRNRSTQIKDVILLNDINNGSEIKSIRSLLMKDNEPLSDEEVYDPRGNNHSIAFIIDSSGTTGPSKGSQLAHYDFATRFVTDSYPTEKIDGQILLGASPLAHLSGLFSFILTLVSGAKIISLRNNTLEDIISAIEKYKVTRFTFSPSMITQIMKAERPIDLSSLQRVFVGGSRLPKGLGDEFVEKFKIKEFRHAYSMTELTVLATIGEHEIGNFESVGKVAVGIKIKIVDTETGAILGENEKGEICVKGPFEFKGYYKNEKLTNELLDSDGFIKTGDIGYFDENENFFVIDRIKDIILQNGFSYSPFDVEEVLMKHEAVEEVAVVGIPDEIAGEISHAFVVLRQNVNKETVDKQQLIDFVNKEVSQLKQLKGGIHWVTELPKTSIGKILRRKLREEYLKRCNCE